ncbi:hypothetical protein QR680_015467 [Steinernema hermaphroditum]|uniref:Aminopeptidase n=1 Tax=Steinernema hermaphroditum TaxID=289476 RepID=A0AA39H9P8_9BILA|nr:hypothetical protein QR680_015467 [Steinernema hermaphroditum]
MSSVVLLLLLLSVVVPVFTTKAYPRLPTFANPTHYDIYIRPDLVKFTIEGVVKVDLEITNETDYLKLHSTDLEILGVALLSQEDEGQLDLPYHLDPENQFLVVNLTLTVKKGDHLTIRIVYNGTISDKLHGIYRSTYKDSVTNETKHLLATQFESTYARGAFPCWDEPLFKAKFSMTLDVDKKLTAISNMPEVETTERDGRKVVKFEMTPPMSTYLIAMAVGELEYLEGYGPNSTRVRIYTTPGKTNLAHLALETHIKALEYYSKLFDFPYPLKKCDGIALPDFALGAMENWGLITYRESFLLMDVHTTAISLIDKLVTIIGHEVGHFWFGNLVTMKWWDNLWLKEGFATFLQYLFSADNYPQYRAWEAFLTNDVDVARDLDSLEHSHPIEVPIENPAELDLIYDGVSYEKSGAIIRMLYIYLGRNSFVKGLRSYIKKHQYSNAESDDLWSAFSDATGKDIRTLMSCWTKQIGYPVVTVALNDSKEALEFSQERFLASGKKTQNEEIWQIPLNIEVGKDYANTSLWTSKEGEFQSGRIEKAEYVQLNHACSGFYHVQYSELLFDSLLKAYQRKEITKENRFTLLADTAYLTLGGRVPITHFLDLIKASSNENSALVLTELDAAIFQLDKIIEQSGNENILSKFRRFISETFKQSADKIGWERVPGEDTELTYARESLKAIMVTVGDAKTLNESITIFAEKKAFAPELKLVVYKVIARDGLKGFRSILRLFEECTVAEEKRTFRMALGYITDEEALKDLLNYILVKSNVRSQDLFNIIGSLGHTPIGQKMGWQFVKKNFKRLAARYEAPTSYTIVEGITRLLGTTTDVNVINEVKALFSAKDAEQIHRSLGELKERIYIYGRQWKLHGETLAKWLDKNGY